jgi:DNA-directed RNA polymerase specialized sigma24 family protein
MTTDSDAGFEEFMAKAEPALRRALCACYGVERGREAAADALAYAWQHWDHVRKMTNPLGYLFRVGQSTTRTARTPTLFARPDQHDPWTEPALPRLLSELTERQRVAVVLVHGFGWTLREVADLTGIQVTSVQTHLERGLARLRRALEVANHD